MAQIMGLTNFAKNIEGTMLKIKKGEKVSQSELQSILQFYLEVVNYLHNQVNS